MSEEPTITTTTTDDLPQTGSRFWLRLRRQHLALIALIYLALLVLVALLANWLAPYDPAEQNLRAALQLPSADHWLGTDNLGRDTLSRLIFGGRLALLAALQGVSIAMLLGVPIGLLAGARGGWIDRIVMWFNNLFLSLPNLIVAFAILSLLGTGLTNAMLAVGLVLTTRYVALTRGVTLAEREELYVEAANVVGVKPWTILWRHILPNIASSLIVQTSLLFGAVMLIEASLSFLGVGAPVGTPSWGRMLSEARSYFGQQPFLAVPPGLAITFTVLAFNLLGDGIRDALGKGEGMVSPKPVTAQDSGTEDASGSEAGAQSANEGEPLLLLRQLKVSFPRPGDAQQKTMTILHDVNLQIRAGETLGLVGESGSGKSMTALALLGLVPAPGVLQSGSVQLAGRELVGLPESELQQLRGNQIAMIFQEPLSSLNPAFTVGDQIGEVLRTHRGLSKSAARKETLELLAHVQIPDPERRIDQYPHQFSGGMAQRVLIARALACNPKVLIADEPTTALDVTVQAQVLELLRRLQKENGMAILFITHDLGVVANICDRVAVMYAGEIVETGTTHDLLRHPKHPYTHALLRAMPQINQSNDRLIAIPGQVPPAWNWPQGCRFHPRCNSATDACRSRAIPLRQVGKGRLVRCVLEFAETD